MIVAQTVSSINSVDPVRGISRVVVCVEDVAVGSTGAQSGGLSHIVGVHFPYLMAILK